MSKQEEFNGLMKTLTESVIETGAHIQMPPPMLETLPTEFIDFELGKSLTGRVRFDPKFTNPRFSFQGGFMAAAIDNVLGPLTYIVAQKTAVTIEMSMSFIRPFVEQDEYVTIYGELIYRSRSALFLRADVKNKEEKLVATATQHALIKD